ncbi:MULTISPECIES: Ig-like domain-containing protein [unclassified Tenacibaculum]|uniref:Ig-like domain-containing protein n=1 Tax=unclassified Tenacibaculum TaxID=2635139 RepID=UPI001F1804DD|nr:MULTISPECIES: Ig-like domain-containing protein [unclassified Tenacibaculum]MCF2874964.1 Ig-like domain-containing protein [Tenacibaculum sp. Cn5-1]MCF2935040.1 Ig-like domain-containing protein [Tenacibaculum sp. Cn5-34]MCG7511518.1 Ig-like domain-containing protein [Tenacibaculum sp. Cn5-46]
MKKLIILLNLFLTIFSFAQTNISGAISSDTTWSLANSPYIITGNTVVFSNSILTIEPGVVIKFNNDVQLRVQGSLIAKGNKNNNIIFTSNNSTPQKGAWQEINLEFNASFIFEYVTVEYASNALRYNYVKSSSIKNSIFQFNNSAIKVDPGRSQWPIYIDHTKFLNNDKGIANYHDEVNLTNCEFKNNRIGAELVESKINLCLFEGNTEIGLDGHTSTISNSTFLSNNIGLKQSFSGGNESSVMKGNTIKNNEIGLKITGNNPTATFSNNTLCNNSKYNVENTSKFSGQNLSNNCWCTSDIDEIEKTIFHGIDNINYGIVIFSNISTGCPDTTIDVPPTLADKFVSTDEDTIINIALNAIDPDSNQITYKLVSPPSNGNISIINNIVTYIPFLNFNGNDSFTVTASDDQFTSAPATISVKVEAINDSPIAYNDSIQINEGETITALQNGEISLLHNDTDVDDNSLTPILVTNPSHGELTLNSNGTFLYKHDGSNTVSDSFTYKINDGNLDSNIATVNIIIKPLNNNIPSDIILSNNSVKENVSSMKIGEFTTIDLDLPSDSHKFELINGIGDDNNNLFTISNNSLFNIISFDYENKKSASIRVKVTDENNQSYEKIFNINIVNINDINITYESYNSYCSSERGSGSITITSVNDTTGNLTYNWSATNGGKIPSGQEKNKNLTNLSNGTYNLSLSDDNYTYTQNFYINLIPQYDKLSICYVSSDFSQKTKNRIFLNNKDNFNIDVYEILRETSTTNVYNRIGLITPTENSFLDDTSDNTSQSYNYKVRLIDKCGNYSPSTNSHKTILLQSSISINKTVNLSWSHYKGIDFSTYTIYRNKNQEGYEEIASVSSNSNSFNDINANTSDNNYEYYISINTNNCSTKINNRNNFTEIKSNYQSLGNIDYSKQIFVYPIPTNDILNIKLPSTISSIRCEIYNTIGQMVMKTEKTSFTIKNLPSSTYFIKIITSKGIITKSFIKQ